MECIDSLHMNVASLITAQQNWTERVGMQSSNGAPMRLPDSLMLRHLARYHIGRVDSNGPVI